MNGVFLDTGYILAIELAKDGHHQEAVDHWRQARPSLPTLVTTSFVFDDVVTYFNCRRRHDKALELGNMLLNSSTVKMELVDEPLFRAGGDMLVQHSDKTWSLTDCISLLVMRRPGLQEAWAFDRHFEQAGFRRIP